MEATHTTPGRRSSVRHLCFGTVASLAQTRGFALKPTTTTVTDLPAVLSKRIAVGGWRETAYHVTGLKILQPAAASRVITRSGRFYAFSCTAVTHGRKRAMQRDTHCRQAFLAGLLSESGGVPLCSSTVEFQTFRSVRNGEKENEYSVHSQC